MIQAANPTAADATETVSIVVPLYNEVDNVDRLIEAIREALGPDDGTTQIVFVDDGSTDGTAAAIARLAQVDPSVNGVYLARNYGQSTAMQAGFDTASGDLIVTMDGDLQNDPADIPAMISVLRSERADVVAGWRKDRKDRWLRSMLSRVANRLIGRLTGLRLHDFGCSLRVYRRDVLDRTRLYGELHRFLPALLSEVGADVREVVVQHHPRRHGSSKYNLDRTIRVVLDLLLILFFQKYLQRSLHLFGGTGLACLVPGLAILSYMVVIKLGFGASIADRPLLTLGVLLVLIGVVLIGQGLIGELVARLVYEAGGRPQYHLRSARQIVRLAEPNDSA